MRALALGGILLLTAAAHAQSGVGVELDEVVDNRISAGMLTGSLELRVKLKGSAADKATAARVVVKEARDDRGTTLTGESRSSSDFTARDVNNGTLQFSLHTPARAASSIKVKGAVELFVPGRDPNSMVKVDKALTKLDAPLSNKTLKLAKIEITPLSHAGYAAERKKHKLEDKDIEKIRAEGKARGVPEKEVEMMIGLAKAMESIDTDPPATAVILSGKKADFDRIYRIDILGSDGKPLDIPSRSTTTHGDASVMTLEPSAAPPDGAALQFYLLTEKSRVTSPFELSVPLP